MSEQIRQVDVIIVGGGMVGLVLALALAEHQFNVAVVEVRAPQLVWEDKAIARVSAINLASLNVLKNLGVLETIAATSCASIQRLFVWDEMGGGDITFDSADFGVAELGKIIENRAIIKTAWEKLVKLKGVRVFIGAPQSLQKEEKQVVVTLDTGEKLAAPLCVGADGVHSWVRDKMQTVLSTCAYQSEAIIAVVSTERPHQHTGWQVFLPEGPLALLPLADEHQCAIVFSQKETRARELMQLSELAFACELNNAFGNRLGEIKCLSGRQSFPLIERHAEQYVEPHLALVGDAAHAIHPLAGQGVNLGFLDVAALTACLCEAREKNQAVGSLKPLRRYARWRRGDTHQMICAMRAFHDVFTSHSSATVMLRSQGLSLVDKATWLKRHFMRVALGQSRDLPSLAKV